MTYPQPVGSVELKFEFPVSTSPTGVELVFGATVIPAEPQDLIPGSATHTAFGDHLVHDPRVLAAGFDTAEFGAAAIELETPNIYPAGRDSSEFGDAYIADKPEPTRVTFNSDAPGVDGVDGFESGDTFVDHFLRYIEVDYTPQEEWGTAFIGDRYRYLHPDGTPMDGYGDIEVTFPKQLLPPGLDATLYGDTHVAFHNVAFPPGVVTSTLGQPFVAFRIRHAVPFAQQYIDWGSTKVDLWQRYLTTYHPPESNADGELYGQYTTVLNRNKTIGMVGLLAQQISTSPAYLELTGRAIQPPSIDDGAFGEGTFVSYRIRSVRVQGYEVDRYPNNTTVYNNAATIRIDGSELLQAGTPAVDKLLKFVTPYTARQDGYGTPWAAPRVRYLTPTSFDAFSKTNAHYVSHTPYIVNHPGLDNGRLGGPFVYARPPITVYPSWGQLWVQDQKQMGIPAVRRYPPLIEVPGRPYTEFHHQNFVSFRVRSVQPPAITEQEKWGVHVVRDRTFYIGVVGTRVDGYEDNNRVENALNIVVPTTQFWIDHNDDSSDAFGDSTVEQMQIEVPSIGSASQFGDALVWSNTIVFAAKHHPSPSGGWTSFGLPLVPGQTVVNTAGFDGPTYGHPNMSHRRIYCTPDYPVGYNENWQPPTLNYDWGGLVAGYGAPTIVHKRTLYIDGSRQDSSYLHKALYGVPYVVHKTQQVFPPSMVPFRSGTAQLWPHEQTVITKGTLFTTFGLATVPPEVGTPGATVPGTDMFEGGDNQIMLKNRRVYQHGSDLLIAAADADHPGLNDLFFPIVGEWLKVYPDPIVEDFGTADVSNYIRYVYPEPKESDWGDIFVIRPKQTVRLSGEPQTQFGIFDNTRDCIIRPYSVQFLCPTSPYTQVLHA